MKPKMKHWTPLPIILACTIIVSLCCGKPAHAVDFVQGDWTMRCAPPGWVTSTEQDGGVTWLFVTYYGWQCDYIYTGGASSHGGPPIGAPGSPSWPLPAGAPLNPYQCKKTIDNWPAGCSKTVRPVTPPPDGCSDVPDSYFYLVSFTADCNWHDSCYATLGNSKGYCDSGLGDRMKASCDAYFRRLLIGAMRTGNVGDDVPAVYVANEACHAQAQAYRSGLALVPSASFYDPGQATAQCQKAHDDRKKYCGSR